MIELANAAHAGVGIRRQRTLFKFSYFNMLE